jgi:fluoride exporter
LVDRLLGTAAVGSYTTSATWLLEPHRREEDGEVGAGIGNVAISIVVGVAAAAFGRVIGAHA